MKTRERWPHNQACRFVVVQTPTGPSAGFEVHPQIRRDYERLFDDFLPVLLPTSDDVARAIDRLRATGRSRWYNELLEHGRRTRLAAERTARIGGRGEPEVADYYAAHVEADAALTKLRRGRTAPGRLGSSAARPTRGRPARSTSLRDEDLAERFGTLPTKARASASAAARALVACGAPLGESALRQRLARLARAGAIAFSV